MSNEKHLKNLYLLNANDDQKISRVVRAEALAEQVAQGMVWGKSGDKAAAGMKNMSARAE